MAAKILFALWFFIPAGFANTTPIIAAKTPGLRLWGTPVDLGKRWRGQRLFGDHKTWRGITTGIIIGIIVLWAQVLLYEHWAWLRSISPINYENISILWLGFLLSFGALLGDLLKSFFKRQFGVISGKSWFPFDQLDYIAGGLLLSSIYIKLPAKEYLWIIFIYFGLHLLFSYMGYKLKLKEQPI